MNSRQVNEKLGHVVKIDVNVMLNLSKDTDAPQAWDDKIPLISNKKLSYQACTSIL